MSEADEAAVKREKELEERIQSLEKHLERLTQIVDEDPAHTGGVAPLQKNKVQKELFDPTEEMPELSEEVLGWVSRNSLLPRLAAVCFLMVVALILRTMTDSGFVGKLPGSAIGMFYAAALMAFAWFKYLKESSLAPVFAVCGAILMSSIVVETHAHFKALPLVPAYLTLMATGLAMALMSRRFNAFAPISVGVLGMCLAGAAIDYPHPYFPYLSLVLLTANILGFFATRIKRCSWLRWSALIVTMVMLQLWGIRLGILLGKKEVVPPDLAFEWYLPTLAIFFLTFIVLSLVGILNSGSQKISRFDFSLPTISVIWAFTLARHVAEVSQVSVTALGFIGLFGVAVLFGMSVWCAGQKADGAPGTNTYAFAGATLLALSLPVATDEFVMTLPVVSLAAMALAIVSRKWENGAVRGSSYLLNLYASVALLMALRGGSQAANQAIYMLPAGVVGFLSIYHYIWCRQYSPPSASLFFDSIDRKDRTAALLLLGGVASCFIMLRIVLFQTLPFITVAMQKESFSCGQSILINGAAVVIIATAYFRKDKELRNIAVLVTLVGATKVFLYDLLSSHGLPLVLSVFTFGVAAALESLALSKWQKQPDKASGFNSPILVPDEENLKA